MSDDSRRRILERRATFVAAAIGATLASAGCDRPQTCLAAVADEKVPKPTPGDASVPGPTDVGGTEPPLPCLEIAEPPDAPKSVACLSVHIPRDAGKPSGKPCLSVDPTGF